MISDTEGNESTEEEEEDDKPKNDYKNFLLFDDLQETTSESDSDFALVSNDETTSDSSQSEVEDLIEDLKKDLRIQRVEKLVENHNKSGRENYFEQNSSLSSEFEFVDKNKSSPQPSGLQDLLSSDTAQSKKQNLEVAGSQKAQMSPPAVPDKTIKTHHTSPKLERKSEVRRSYIKNCSP